MYEAKNGTRGAEIFQKEILHSADRLKILFLQIQKCIICSQKKTVIYANVFTSNVNVAQAPLSILVVHRVSEVSLLWNFVHLNGFQIEKFNT